MRKKKSVPSGTLTRLSTISKAAIKCAGKQVTHMASSALASAQKKQQKAKKHHQKLGQDMFNVVSTLKGAALKAAQLITTEFDLFPAEFQAELEKSCYLAPPLNRAIVYKVIQNQFKQSPDTVFKEFEPQAFAAASIGQVHKGKTHQEKTVAIKIQYPGIDKTIEQDMRLLRLVLKGLPLRELKNKSTMINIYLTEIEQRFIEETDYIKEKKHLDWFYTHNPFKQLMIPQSIDNCCSKHVLTMTLLPGQHVTQWLKQNPTQQQRDQAAQLLWDSFIYFFINHNILHADPNSGNYLFTDTGQVGLIDFGCVKQCNKDYPLQIKRMMTAYIQNDITTIMTIYNTWQILPKHLVNDNKTVANYIKHFQQWITKPFKYDIFDFNEHPTYMAERFNSQFKQAVDIIHTPNHHFVMFDRTYIGLLNIFNKMKARVRFSFDVDLL